MASPTSRSSLHVVGGVDVSVPDLPDAEASGYWRYLPSLAVRAYGEWMAATLNLRTEIQEFLRSRRARIAPEMAGLPAYGGKRRVKVYVERR
jgi:hypothetical protein